MPTLRQLEYLVAIADTLHFRRAAERVNTTQPTLSEQLKALEDRLGVHLVERTRARVVLTPVGAEIVEIARKMLRQRADIRAIAERHDGKLGGVLRVGLSPTVGAYMLSRVVPELHRRFPQLKLFVREDMPQVLMRSLDDGTYDFVIAPMPVRGADIVSEPLFKEGVYLAVANDHPLAGRRVVEREDLRGAEVLTLIDGYHLHQMTRDICVEVGARIRYDYEGTSLDTLREMVATGLGITFLPALYVKAVASRDPSIRIKEVQGLNLQRTVVMAWRQASARHTDLQEIVDIARRTVDATFEIGKPPVVPALRPIPSSTPAPAA